jgi:hypothetical protein
MATVVNDVNKKEIAKLTDEEINEILSKIKILINEVNENDYGKNPIKLIEESNMADKEAALIKYGFNSNPDVVNSKKINDFLNELREKSAKVNALTLTTILNNLKKNNGGKLLIAKQEKKVFIKYEKLNENEDNDAKKEIQIDKMIEKITDSITEINIKKEKNKYYYWTNETGNSPSFEITEFYLLYETEQDSNIKIIGENVFKNLFDAFQSSFLLLMSDEDKLTNIRDILKNVVFKNIYKKYNEILKIISILSIETKTSGYLFSRREEFKEEELNKKNNLEKLKRLWKEFDKEILDALNLLKDKFEQLDNNCLRFLIALDNIKTEFINTLINIYILLQTAKNYNKLSKYLESIHYFYRKSSILLEQLNDEYLEFNYEEEEKKDFDEIDEIEEVDLE